MGIDDLIIIPIYFTALFLIGFTYILLSRESNEVKSFFLGGLALKLSAGLIYCLLFSVYYGGTGDTFQYFKDGSVIYDQLLNNFDVGWGLLFLEEKVWDTQTCELMSYMFTYQGTSMALISKFSAVIGLLTFNNFYATTLIFSVISFSGMWALYKVMIDLYPKLTWQMAIACLFVPSVVFWGSGIMKDTVTIGCTGWFVYGFYHLLIKKDKLIVPIVVMTISALLILNIKFYILAALLPGLMIWFVGHHFSYFIGWRIKSIVSIFCMSAIAFLAWFLWPSITGNFENLLEAFISEALGFQRWHSFLFETEGGSGYNLGEIDFTPIGILKKVPASINVSLFRPYLFEVKNPIMLVTSLESTAILMLSIYAFFKAGAFRFFKIICSKPILLGFIIFVFALGFIVGFTSFNFGALARYKIPFMPFYLAFLFIIIEEARLANKAARHLDRSTSLFDR